MYDHEVVYAYDGLGRKTKMIADPNSPSYPDRINQVTEYAYDTIGRQISISGYAKDSDAATKQSTTYDYDKMGRITKITYPDSAAIEYAYNAAGKVWKRTDQRGIETFYTYDHTYTMTQKQVTAGGTATTELFTYDGLGRMLTAQKLEGQTQISLSEFAYNDLGRMSGASETLLTLSEKNIQYAYDNAGFRTQITYPDSSVINRTNDWAGRINTLTQGSTTLVDYSYIGSRTAQRAYPEPDVTTTSKYDNLGRIATIDAGTGYVKFDYAYVAKTNNIDSIQFDHRTGQPYNTFQYDGLDRITNVQYLSNQNDVEAFPMDDLGNRVGNVTQRDGVHNYTSTTPNLTNRYTAIDSNSITHDAAGNMTVDSKGYQYVYDYENRVVSISKLWGETEVPVADYVYDALGRRIQRTVYREGNLYYTDRFYYNDSWQYLMKEMYWPGDDPVCVNFVYGNYIDELLLCQNGTSTRYYYLHDHLYSPAAAISSSGTILERCEYDVYGNQRIFDNTWQTRAYSWFCNFGLTGREIDMLDWDANGAPRLQHMHYRHRDCSPFMGRFMQHDPLGIVPASINLRDMLDRHDSYMLLNQIFYPLIQYHNARNLYQYATSKPNQFSDPFGLLDPYEECRDAASTLSG